MTYPPTDRLHRHFRFPQVLRYSLCVQTRNYPTGTQVRGTHLYSDSIGTPVMFTGSIEFGYDQDGWFTRLFPLARLISELLIVYITYMASNYVDFNKNY
jgi:hypothetical protein